jgi:hypothetical protein
MTLPASGLISMSQVNTELQNPLTSVIRLNDSQVRALAGKPSGTIRMSDLYGKSSWKYGSFYVIGSWSNRTYGLPVGAFGMLTDTTGTLDQPGTTAPSSYNANGHYGSLFLYVSGCQPYNYFDLTLVETNSSNQLGAQTPPGSFALGGQCDENGEFSDRFNVPNDTYWYPGSSGEHYNTFKLWEKSPTGDWVTQGVTFRVTRAAGEGFDYNGPPYSVP